MVSALSLAGVVGAVRILYWYWPGSFFHNAASGTWTALAWDFAHGELYRPVLSSSGYGGTRYMPLLFMLHGLLIRLHLDPIHSGVLLMQGSVAIAALGLYAALRAAGVMRPLALPFALTPWATVTYEKFSTDVRADYLAAAFVVIAVAATCVATRDSRARWLWCIGAACVLAIFTKLTAIVFVVPIAFALGAGGSRPRAIRFTASTFAACLLLLGALQWASAGRFLDNFQATITAGTRIPDLWRRGVPTFIEQLWGDPMIGVPFVLAVWSLTVAVRRREWSIVDGYVLAAALLTCGILASPGTSSNHMIELQIAVALGVAVAIERSRLSDRLVARAYAVLVAIMIAITLPLPWMPSPIRTLRRLGPRRRATVEAIREEFLSPQRQYLSLNALLPVLLNERPMVLDSFSLDLFVKSDAAAGRDLRSRISCRSFGTVIVDDDGLFSRDSQHGDAGFTEAATRFWTATNPVVRLFASDYEVWAVRRPFVILRPRDAALVGAN
jgi:hypothetical protein